MIKLTVLLKRNPKLSHEEYVAYHKTRHAELFMSIPAVRQTVRRYVQQHAIEGDLPGMPPLLKYDGVTELWFDDFAAMARCFSDPEYLAKVRPDEQHLFDIMACDFFVSLEHPVFDAGKA